MGYFRRLKLTDATPAECRREMRTHLTLCQEVLGLDGAAEHAEQWAIYRELLARHEGDNASPLDQEPEPAPARTTITLSYTPEWTELKCSDCGPYAHSIGRTFEPDEINALLAEHNRTIHKQPGSTDDPELTEKVDAAVNKAFGSLAKEIRERPNDC